MGCQNSKNQIRIFKANSGDSQSTAASRFQRGYNPSWQEDHSKTRERIISKYQPEKMNQYGPKLHVIHEENTIFSSCANFDEHHEGE